MKRYLTGFAVAGVVVTSALFTPSALANSNFAVSIGVPGVAFGYSNYGGYVATYPAPSYYYPPAPVYYGPTYYAPPVGVVTYGGTYYRPWHRHYYGHYYRHW